ncbi:MAG TPA: polysaccharide deacetylase family protein [Candidatus Angelobacter sp.]
MYRRSSQLLALVLGLAACLAGAQDVKQPARPTVQERLGYPASARLLIIHADDLGMSHSVNRATFEALEKHWITSSSILVPCPWFPEVVRFAQTHPEADLGIHLALNSEWTTYRWFPLSAKEKVPSLLDHDGYMPLEETTVAQQAKAPEVALELQAQIDRALAAGIHISHLDTHMTALVGSSELFRVYQQMGQKYRLPILVGNYRTPQGAVLAAPENLVQAVIGIDPGVPPGGWLNWYEKTLAALSPGVYELIVHLGYDDEEMRGATSDHPDWGAGWRQLDLDMVKSDAFQKFLREQGFILITWKDLAKALQSTASSAH